MESTETKQERNLSHTYDKSYKFLLIIPAALLIFSLVYLGIFYSNHGDIFKKDITLTGGTSITIYDNLDTVKLESILGQKLTDLEITQLYDVLTQQHKGIIISTTTDINTARPALEQFLGYKLDEKNSSIEFTGPTLSAGFYAQLQRALIAAFLLMSMVVFLLFGTDKMMKIYAVVLSLFCLNFLFTNLPLISPLIKYVLLPLFIIFIPFIKANKKYYFKWPVFGFFIAVYIIEFFMSFSILLIPFILLLTAIYILFSVPSLAVILSAFADIMMTIVVVDLLGIKVSSAGVVAFLMLIGYSVDTDIMLTNRLLRNIHISHINKNLGSAFKTGMSMTLTVLFTILAALFIVSALSPVLYQIFTILFIGLCFDIFNTWVTNASMLKWYLEIKLHHPSQNEN